MAGVLRQDARQLHAVGTELVLVERIGPVRDDVLLIRRTKHDATRILPVNDVVVVADPDPAVIADITAQPVLPAVFRPGDITGRPADGDIVIAVSGILRLGEADLFEVVHAGRAASALPGLIQRRQQHRGQNRDDRDHDQEFNQRKIFFHYLPPANVWMIDSPS